MSFLSTLALRWGLIEPVVVELDPGQEPIMVPVGVTIDGDIRVDRDVIVEGVVNGGVYCPDHRVVVAPSGRISRGQVKARRVVWAGAFGGANIDCASLDIRASATTQAGDKGPTATYEQLLIAECINVEVFLKYGSYCYRGNTASKDNMGSPQQRSQ